MASTSSSNGLLVSLRDVTLGYGRRVVLDHVNLDIAEGAFLGIVGPNGSGKTTLLRAILGQLRPLAGTADVGAGRGGSRVRFGYIPQYGQTDERYPLSAGDIVAMGAYPRGLPLLPAGRAAREAAEQALEMVGAADLAGLPFRHLSGGQKQRVLVARALATGARALLLDEPTNDMDLAGQHDLMETLCDLHQSAGLTIVAVSHMLDVIFSYVQEMIIICDGELISVSPGDPAAARALESIYGRPVEVVTGHGRRAILVGDHNGA